MYKERGRYLWFRSLIITIQRVAKIRYCAIRVQRRHRQGAELLLAFLQVGLLQRGADRRYIA